MFTATPPRSSIATDEQNTAGAAAAAMQRKRARPDQLFQASSPAHHLVAPKIQCHMNNDIRIAGSNISSSSSTSLAGNPTVMVSPFIDNAKSSNTNTGGMISSTSSPMTARLEPLIECGEEELPETYTNQQQQQQLPLSQTSLVSTKSSITTFASSIHNNADHDHLDYSHQPPMKRVKVDQRGTTNDEEFKDVVIPLEECHDDEEMFHNSPDHAKASKPTNSLMNKLLKSGNASSLATVSRRNNDSSCSTVDSVVCCHVCGGQGDSATANSDSKNGGCTSNIGGSCASRSIASYFQVTKKQSSSSKLPSQPAQSSSYSSRTTSSHHATTITSNNNNQHLPPCRYCDRPTCNNNPSCIKQCEECQHNFCSFCCKVNYDGMYEKTVCFECDELLMLSHCCDRMEL